MRLLFIINTPGQAHTWKNVMGRLADAGHEAKVLARDYGSTPQILLSSGLAFDTFSTVGARYSRLLGAAHHFQTCYRAARSFDPALVVGFGIDAAFTAARLRRRSIVFIDDDHTWFQNYLTRYAGATIVTPDCFQGDLGRRHLRIRGYKELAYLHPSYFKPDPTVLRELGVGEGEKYAILRFNARDAVHDIGNRQASLADRLMMVKELEKYARVFVSGEASLAPELAGHELKMPYERFHHALYYAHLYAGDTGTAGAEAALLGTPALYLTQRSRTIGNFADLERRGLMFVFREFQPALEKAADLLKQPDIKSEWASRRARILAGSVDVTAFLANLIEEHLSGPGKGERQR